LTRTARSSASPRRGLRVRALAIPSATVDRVAETLLQKGEFRVGIRVALSRFPPGSGAPVFTAQRENRVIILEVEEMVPRTGWNIIVTY